MKKLSTIFLLLLLFTLYSSLSTTYASNVTVTNVSLTNVNVAASTVDIKFDLSQDNTFSGTDANGASFYDRVWIFVKFWKDGWATDGTVAWKHATLTSGGTVTPTDGKGAFCQVGTNQTVRWNYGTDGIVSTNTVKVKVMAIEMVYIPQGSFYAGDGSTGTTARFKQGNSDSAYQVTSEAAITVGTSAGNLYYGATGGNYGDGLGPIPAAFPKGYNGFYIMKYEISQGQYCDFVNTLITTQASARFDSGGHFNTNRNFIKKSGDAVPKYGCDANNNAGAWGSATYSLMNEADDGQNVACNYLSWADLCYYADWAGLRPMTELEFEKACRGGSPTTNVLAGELAWGSAASATSFSSLFNSGQANEGPSIDSGVSVYIVSNLNYSDCLPDGPIRCGAFAGAGTTRIQAGASYYGVMELSGNLWERPVTVGHSTGRSFTGTHGNGDISDGLPAGWPASDAIGAGYRGGSWLNGTTYSRVSDRNLAANVSSVRDINVGGRCTRTSP